MRKPHKTFVEIESSCKTHFAFLETDYSFVWLPTRWESYGFEASCKSEKVGVKIMYEIPEWFVFVTLCRLVNGQFPIEPLFVTQSSELHCFELNNLILATSGELPITHKEVIEHSIIWLIEQLAIRTRLYASDVLQGNFSIFPVLEQMIKGRRQYPF